MQVVDTYTFAPGQCYTCSGTELPAIDTQRDTNLGAADGRVYLCGSCVGAMWSMMSGAGGSPGLVPARSYTEQADRAQRAEARSADLEEALQAIRGESPLTGALIALAETMGRAFTPAEPDVTIDVGPPAAETATAPDGTTVPVLDPSTVPAGDAPAAEAEPFPAPAADTVEAADEAPPAPADDAPAEKA